MKDMTGSYKLLSGVMAEIKIQHINLISDECSACSWLRIKIRLLVCKHWWYNVCIYSSWGGLESTLMLPKCFDPTNISSISIKELF